MKKRWTVKHREGSCAVKDGQQPEPDAMSVATLCDHFVVLPMGSEFGHPDCKACIAAAEES
jgi:hypothetical protein